MAIYLRQKGLKKENKFNLPCLVSNWGVRPKERVGPPPPPPL